MEPRCKRKPENSYSILKQFRTVDKATPPAKNFS